MTPALLKAMLAALPTAVQSRLRPAFVEAAGLVQAEAARNLAASAKSVAESISVVGTASGAAVEANGPVAVFLEYGTARMAARPFLRPAVDATAEEVRTTLAGAFGVAVASAMEDRQ